MASDRTEEQALDALSSLARDAAPAREVGPHVSEAVVATLRAGGDADDDVFRHIASCAACRARMVVPAEDVQKLSAHASREDHPSPVRRVRTPWILWAAAAGFVLVLAIVLAKRPHDEPLVLSVRSYVGTMGGGGDTPPRVAPPHDVPLEDQNLEVTLRAEGAEAAILLVFDEKGGLLAPPRPFSSAVDGTLKVAVAPRTFPPHAGKARGIVVAGKREVVAESADAARRGGVAEGISSVESRIRASSPGARIGSVTLEN